MNTKIKIVIDGGQVAYVFSNASAEIEVIDYDMGPASTQQKEEMFEKLNKELFCLLAPV